MRLTRFIGDRITITAVLLFHQMGHFMEIKKQQKVVIVGGCGHVGLSLGIVLADVGFSVVLLDINTKANDLVNSGQLPFLEHNDADVVLKRVVKEGKLIATADKEQLKSANIVVFIIGTPVDEHLNPRVSDVINSIKRCLPYLNGEQLIILRSTVYPGVVEIVDQVLQDNLGKHKLSFCPERIAQGQGLSELRTLPQLVSATSKEAEDEATEFFLHLTPTIKMLKPIEAEIAKLVTNSWRYLEFAIANQFYMMIESQDLDFYKIYDALSFDYPRAKHFATPGFAAGPCLFKDTMQLSAFHKNHFFLGHSAMLVNEGLPVFLVDQMEKKLDGLKDKKIAILGMAFKANNDDKRDSLSYKLKKALEIKMAEVLISDIYDKDTLDFNEAIKQADGVILGAPHREYLSLKLNKPFVDCWGVWRRRG
jgi:UDP-N-acetyl-D-mannosaminuronic acid dehydrogenase